MQRLYFSLDIPARQYLRYYQGSAGRVLVQASDGRRLSLPAANLRPFVTVEGVRGQFCATIDPNNRLISLERHPQ